MFVNKNQLEYLLPTDHYTSEEQHRRDIDYLMKPTWHVVGTTHELRKHGDFRTLDLCGEPLQIRNLNGEFHAFLNVCSHRHCLLTHQAKGNDPTLRCQYHGWEYEASGRTRKIPEAGCFRPFDREHARLHKFPLERCGDLLFVALSEEIPPLREFLGERFDFYVERFSGLWKPCWNWDFDFESNWKIPLENTVESYHILAVHPGSFGGMYPGETHMTHTLDEERTTLTYDVRDDPKICKLTRFFCKLLGGTPTDTYIHHHIHPNMVMVTTDLFSYAQAVIPTSPTTSRTILRMFSYRGPKRGPLAAYLAWMVGKQAKRVTRRVMLEDAGIFPHQQRGLASTRFRGCIGTREERIYTFHQYLLNRMPEGAPIEELARSKAR